jgi:hypothetical protein
MVQPFSSGFHRKGYPKGEILAAVLPDPAVSERQGGLPLPNPAIFMLP